MQVTLELRPSKIHINGVGVFAVNSFRKGQKIADGINKKDYESIISWKHFNKFSKSVQKKITDFCIGTPKGFIPPENNDFNNLTVEWYLNHSCNGNLGFNKNGDFIALRNIKKGEELSYDYGLAESDSEFAMRCTCNSKNCRKKITGNDWKNAEFRKKKSNYMLPALKNVK
jgi:SET domain-containing protein